MVRYKVETEPGGFWNGNERFDSPQPLMYHEIHNLRLSGGGMKCNPRKANNRKNGL
jgi:hypothetical protein